MKKRLLVILFFLLFSISIFQKPGDAFAKIKCPKNTPFICREAVVQLISQAITPLQELINNLLGRTSILEEKIEDLENRVKHLEDLLKPSPSPSPLPSPSPSIIPSPSPIPFEVQFSIVDDIEFDKGTAQANKPIKYCTYASSSSGPNVYLNGNITDTLCMTPELYGQQLLWMRVESFEAEVKSYGIPPY